MSNIHQLSRTAYERLDAEFQDLTTRGRIEIARKIETARELGDLSENGDYQAAKEEQGKMEGRIMHLQRILTDAVIIDATNTAGGAHMTVQLGSVVEVLLDGDTEPERYLVGSIEEKTDDLIVVSPGSPMGQALLGASTGDNVQFQSPGGAIQLQVTKIEQR